MSEAEAERERLKAENNGVGLDSDILIDMYCDALMATEDMEKQIEEQAAEIERLREKVSNSTPLEWVDPGPEDRPEGWYWWITPEGHKFPATWVKSARIWQSIPICESGEKMRNLGFTGPIAPCLPPKECE